MKFINLSNHPSKNWSAKQILAAQEYGEIIDFPFSNVPAQASEEEVLAMAQELVKNILDIDSSITVMCQGEFTLTFALVKLFKENNITVLSACSDRISEEEVKEDGSVEKKSIFEFVRFRRYA